MTDDIPLDRTPRVLIVDDEPLARERIRELLQDDDLLSVDVDLAGEAEDGEEAVEMIAAESPDLVFLDVQMPGASGLDVVDAVGADAMPLTVFVTAYDQYAIDAFEVAAVDYLLKPFDDERFADAVHRACRRLADRTSREVGDALRDLLREHRSTSAPDDGRAPDETASDQDDRDPIERIAVQGRGETRIVSVSDVTHITAEGSYAKLHTPSGTHLVRERMKTLADRLASDTFMRIHRSVIVKLDEVASILRGGGGDYAVRLHDDTRLSLSRSRVDALKERLGVMREE